MLKIFDNQKGLVHLIPLLLLFVGLAVGLYLVQQKTNLLPKAYNEQVSPLLYQQRIDNLKIGFNISKEIDNEQVQSLVKEDLFKGDIVVNGDIANGDATVSVVGDCTKGQTSNYELSEYGVFPPLCLTEEQKEKASEFLINGAESTADFIIPYAQAKKAIELESDMEQVKSLLRKSGLADRVQTNSISSPNSVFGGYIVTLIRIKELEEDVKQNPDGSGKLTLEQEEARREYVAELRNLWEKQHNLSIEVVGVAAVSLIDKPLKVVGEVAKPITGPLKAKAGQSLGSVFNFVKNSWDNLTSKGAGQVINSARTAVNKVRILGKVNPRTLTREEFENSPDLLYHGSSKPFEFSRGYDYKANVDNDGSFTLGNGFYTTNSKSAAKNYSSVRQHGKVAETYVAEILPNQAKMLDFRSPGNLLNNDPVPQDLKEAWIKYFQEHKQEIKDRLADYHRLSIDEHEEFLLKIKDVSDIDLRVMLETGDPKKILELGGTRNFPQGGPWMDDFSDFMKKQGYDGVIYVEGGEGVNSVAHASYVFYDFEKIGTYDSWQK